MGIVQRDSTLITIISYAGAVLGYVNKILLFTNFLTTEQVGLANVLISISVIYAQVASLGSYNIVLRFFPMFKNPGNGHNGFLFGMLALVLSGFALTTLLFLLLTKPFQQAFEGSAPLLVGYMLYIIPLALATVIFHLFEAYLRSLHKNLVPSAIHELILRILVTLCISAYAMGLIGFHEFVVCYVVANCVPAVMIVLYTSVIKQLMITPFATTLLRRLWKMILAYGLFSLFNNLSFFILASVDSLMVTSMIDLGAAGVYTTMMFITAAILIPYRSMVRVSGPLIAAFWRSREMNKMQDLYRKATETNLVIGTSLFMLIWINIDALFYLIPGDYQAGKYVFLILGFGKLVDMTTGLNGTIILTSGKYRYDLAFTLGLVVFAIITNLIFIPILGMNGAAFASTISLTAFNALRIIFIYKHYRLNPLRWKDLSVPLIMGMIILLSGFVKLSEPLLIDVIIRSIIAGMAFILPVYLLRISPDINQIIDKYSYWFFKK